MICPAADPVDRSLSSRRRLPPTFAAPRLGPGLRRDDNSNDVHFRSRALLKLIAEQKVLWAKSRKDAR
jgi:hypothetical protein